MLCNDRKCRHQRTNNKQAHYTCGNFWSLPARSAVPTQSDKAHGFWMQISPSKYFYLNKFPRFQDFCGFNIISAANLWPWGEKKSPFWIHGGLRQQKMSLSPQDYQRIFFRILFWEILIIHPLKCQLYVKMSNFAWPITYLSTAVVGLNLHVRHRIQGTLNLCRTR